MLFNPLVNQMVFKKKGIVFWLTHPALILAVESREGIGQFVVQFLFGLEL